MKRSLAINVLEEELDAGTSFCREKGIGIELTAFAFPERIDSQFEQRVERHAQAVHGISPVILHGPFLDLYATSPDRAIVRVCQERHDVALSAAIGVGASIYVAHLNFIPLIRNTSYRERFPKAAAAFWLPLADKAGAHGITIVLENLWEAGPEVQKSVVREAGHPYLKASFDNGHALVFSNVRARDWIEVLDSDLVHCHLHDNDGGYDHHWAVKNGEENWPEYFGAIQHCDCQPVLVMESDKLDVNRISLANVMKLV